MEALTMGRPTVFQDAEELKEEVNGYFKRCEEFKKVPTISGLAVCLGISRVTLFTYRKKHKNLEIRKILMVAKGLIEANQEEGLIAGTLSAAGTIFSLKNNFDWKDKPNEIEDETKEKSTKSELLLEIEEDEKYFADLEKTANKYGVSLMGD